MTGVFIGCAGWSIGRDHWPRFAEQGTHLQRYAGQFSAVEINSSFYRPHRPQTYKRWADSVGADFRFSVKLPRSITHERRLKDCEGLLDDFFSQCSNLGDRLGCVLVQLPPSLAYDAPVAQAFLQAVRARYKGALALEPRHDSWAAAQACMQRLHIARVAADPAVLSAGFEPGGWAGLQYWRLHGSPRIYHSEYGVARLQALARHARARSASEYWFIFDNTASGHAISDALTFQTEFSSLLNPSSNSVP